MTEEDSGGLGERAFLGDRMGQRMRQREDPGKGQSGRTEDSVDREPKAPKMLPEGTQRSTSWCRCCWH